MIRTFMVPIDKSAIKTPLTRCSKWTGLFLVFLFLFQAALFWPVTEEFFTPDGIYYLARQLDDWDDVKAAFVNLDDVANYRPLTYVVTTVLSWRWALDPFPYHLFTLLMHIWITALVFWLACLLLHSEIAALAMVFFFGLHAAASRVAFGITFISDLLYAVFFIFAIIAFVKFERGFGPRWRVVSLFSFALSLCSKEPAVTLPAVLTAGLVLMPGLSGAPERKPFTWTQALRRTLPFWVLAMVYLGWFAFLTCGWFFPQDPGHPYYFNLSTETFVSKVRYLKLAFNMEPRFDTMAGHPGISALAMRFLPVGVGQSFMQVSDFWLYLIGPLWMLWLLFKREWQYIAEFGSYAFATPLMVVAAWVFFRDLFRSSRSRQDRTVLFGLLFFIVVLLPVLTLPPEKTMLHNLYVPVVGVGILVGHFVRLRWQWQRGRFRKGIGLAISAMLVLAGIHFTAYRLEISWPVTSSRAASKYLGDVQRHHPKLPSGAVLYFERTGSSDWPFLTAGGDLFRVFYGDEKLVTMFGDNEQELPAADRSFGPVLKFRERNGTLVPIMN